VFAAQSECHFAGNTSEDFVRRVNHEPIALDFMSFCGKSFHVDFLNSKTRSNGGSAIASADSAFLFTFLSERKADKYKR
jgi:hypothetical protein